MSAPAVLIIGEVVTLRRRLAWFENRPLFGKRVLVTRPAGQSAGLIRKLEELGASVDAMPVVEIRALEDWSRVDGVLARVKEFDWVVFTSVNGVRAFLGRLLELKGDIRALGRQNLPPLVLQPRIALRSYHLEPDLVPSEFRSEDLSRALRERARGQRVLIARADRGRDILHEELAAVAQVEQIAVYSQVDVTAVDREILARLDRGEIDYVTLTSSNIARAFHRVLDQGARKSILGGRPKLVTISPVTSAAVYELGLPVAAEASTYTSEGLIQALVGCVTGGANRSAEVPQCIPAKVGEKAGGDDNQDVDEAIDAHAERDLDDEVQTKEK